METKNEIKVLRKLKEQISKNKREPYRTSLIKRYEQCKEAFANITEQDLMLLWYLNHSRFGESARFYRFAKKNYEFFKTQNKST